MVGARREHVARADEDDALVNSFTRCWGVNDIGQIEANYK
jgi:hypothetical protein